MKPPVPAPAVDPIDAVQFSLVERQRFQQCAGPAAQNDIGVDQQDPPVAVDPVEADVDRRAEGKLCVVVEHRRRLDDPRAEPSGHRCGPAVRRRCDDGDAIDGVADTGERLLQVVREIDADGDRFELQGQVLTVFRPPIPVAADPSVPALASISVPISLQSVSSIAKTACACCSR